MSFIHGPWVIVEHSWSRTGVYANHICVAVLDIGDAATEETQDEWQTMMAANAKLIAAAPDLLAALQRMVKAANPMPGQWRTPSDDDFAAARAAIAKAQG